MDREGKTDRGGGCKFSIFQHLAAFAVRLRDSYRYEFKSIKFYHLPEACVLSIKHKTVLCIFYKVDIRYLVLD